MKADELSAALPKRGLETKYGQVSEAESKKAASAAAMHAADAAMETESGVVEPRTVAAWLHQVNPALVNYGDRMLEYGYDNLDLLCGSDSAQFAQALRDMDITKPPHQTTLCDAHAKLRAVARGGASEAAAPSARSIVPVPDAHAAQCSCIGQCVLGPFDNPELW